MITERQWYGYNNPVKKDSVSEKDLIIYLMFCFFFIYRGFKACCKNVDIMDEENTVNTDIKRDLRELGKMKYAIIMI